MTSTTCPRLRLELTRSLKPPCDLSTMRQGDLSECPEECTIRLARFLVTIRFDARCSGDKLHLGELVSQHTKQDLSTEVVRQTLESLFKHTVRIFSAWARKHARSPGVAIGTVKINRSEIWSSFQPNRRSRKIESVADSRRPHPIRLHRDTSMRKNEIFLCCFWPRTIVASAPMTSERRP